MRRASQWELRPSSGSGTPRRYRASQSDVVRIDSADCFSEPPVRSHARGAIGRPHDQDVGSLVVAGVVGILRQ